MSVKHGEGDSPLYRLWIRTLYKCTRPNNVQYKNYGLKGITICKDWQSFPNFRDWANVNDYTEGKKLYLKEGFTEIGPDTCVIRFSVRSNYQWSASDDAYLKDNYQALDRKEIGEALGKTPESVSARVMKLCLNKRGKIKKHGDSMTKLYKIWAGVKSRCHSPANNKYKDYGAKGIYVVDEWKDWENFRDWANANGYDGKLLLSRKDLNGPYSPDNCVFANASMRQSGRKWPVDSQIYLVENYKSKTAKEIGKAIGKTASQVMSMASLLRRRGILTERKRSFPVDNPVVVPDNDLSDNDNLLGQSEGLYQTSEDILDDLCEAGRAKDSIT